MREPTMDACAWSLADLATGIRELAEHAGLEPGPGSSTARLLPDPGDSDAVDAWIMATAETLDVEAEGLRVCHRDVHSLICGGGPAILRLPGEAGARYLLLLGGTRRHARIVARDLGVVTVATDQLRDALCRQVEAPLLSWADEIVSLAGVSGRRRDLVRRELLSGRLETCPLEVGWMLRLPPGRGLWAHLRAAGLSRFTGHLALLYLYGAVLGVLSWWLLGAGALGSHVDRSWITSWVLLLPVIVAFSTAQGFISSRLAVRLGASLRDQAMAGALRLHPDEIRHLGVGRLLGGVLDIDAVQALAVGGGLVTLMACLELIVSGWVLWNGAGGARHVLLLVLWLLVSALLARRYVLARVNWTGRRLEVTWDLVERMVGHRTRLVQEPREGWHESEDALLARYLDASAPMDRAGAFLVSVLPRGWLLLGIAGLGPALLASSSTVGIAVGLGGVVMATRALATLGFGVAQLADAGMAWRNVSRLFEAARARRDPGVPGMRLDPALPLLEGRGLTFRHAGRAQAVLSDASLDLRRGERVLLQGPSGSGKSTLISILGGIRRTDTGVLLLGGVDPPTWGERGWHGRVAVAPQFHENHVLAETLAFNLLFGRRWPPRGEDLAEARAICEELRLGDLLDRMPAGMQQVVGEGGWQLSHGERSRLYIARALLQRADLVILDESLAALDPDNVRSTLECVLERAPTLLLAAHP